MYYNLLPKVKQQLCFVYVMYICAQLSDFNETLQVNGSCTQRTQLLKSTFLLMPPQLSNLITCAITTTSNIAMTHLTNIQLEFGSATKCHSQHNGNVNVFYST